ncbi:MAG: GAF domain-containing protein [Geminicoccaceae bacterium]
MSFETSDAMVEMADALALDGQPDAAFDGLCSVVRRLIGVRLFSVMVLDNAAGDVARVYSNQPQAYPVGGRKPLQKLSRWGEQVLRHGQPYLGRTHADIAEAFFDHELIRSLGCGSVINLPVRWDDRIIGTINILDAEHAYDTQSLTRVQPLAPLTIAPMLLACRNLAPTGE